MAAARQVRDQDVDLAGPTPALRRGVAKDRRISVEDAQMRHGRKSRSVLFDGYKRHVLRDLDTGLVPAVGITPANVPEASVTDDIEADLQAAGMSLAELHIDRAYLSSALVRDRGPDLAIFCKAWRVRNTGGRFAKDEFTLDFAAGQLTCPAGVAMPFQPGKTVRFPRDTCAACPLRQRCTASSTGRSVSIHPDEALLAELRQRQQTPEGREELRERVQVEHALAHVGHWQGRRARYLGTRKNLFDLRRVAVVHNLHVIARQPDNGEYQLAADSYLTGALADQEPSAWIAVGSVVAAVVRIAGLVLLYCLRFALAAPETARGLRRMVLDAAPLPRLPETPVPEAIEPPRTKKAVLLALYRVHPDYGDRSRASRVAAELAAQAGLQEGTARTYLYAELDARSS